jgi:deoxyxylulose-5-phosphate synthase
LDYYKIIKKFKKIIFVEKNVAHGDLISRVKCINSDIKQRSQILAFTLKDKFIHSYRTYNDILIAHGLSIDKIIKKI